MNSVMVHDFSKIPPAEIPRSQFDRSRSYKTTLQAGELVPVYLDLAYPGDVFNLNVTAFGRLATPIKPIMDNMWLDFHFFAVPIRLLWSNWRRFMGEQNNPTDSTDFLVPQIVAPSGGFLTGGLADYFGLPVGVANISVSALPFRAYNLIWRDWYKDQNLQVSSIIETDDGPDDIAAYPVLRRSKAHDFFTSCLPFPQKGDDVVLPLGTSAPLSGTIAGDGNDGPTFFSSLGFNMGTLRLNPAAASRAVEWQNVGVSAYGEGQPVKWNDPNLSLAGVTADLSAATAATVNEFREAFQLQRLLERDARGGTRYQELVLAHFGIRGEDFRHQRPEFLGSARADINVHPVTQNSPTGTYADTPQGNLAGYGTLSVNSSGFTKSFSEHCIVVGLASTRTDLHYQRAIWAEWSYKTKYDFYWPALAHLGERAVKNKEIFAQGTSVDDDTFGYQERWAEARYSPSLITGKLNSNETGGTPLDVWHLAQDFSNLPVLNSQFIIENPPMDRVLAVPSESHIILDCFFRVKAARAMPTYSVPGMIDHF